MSRNPNTSSSTPATTSIHRDYGSTSTASVPEVNFSPTEFISLSENIGSNINYIKSNWIALEKAFKLYQGKRGTPSLRDKVYKIQELTNNKIKITSKDLQKLKSIVRYGDKAQKLQLEKLTSTFKSVIEKYSDSQHKIAIKIKEMYAQQMQKSDEQQEEEVTEEERQSLIQQQKQATSSLQFEKDMLIDRETRIREIEEVVLDVNSIMRDLNCLVNEQSEQIDTIENSIESTANDVEAGEAELRKAAEYRTKYRKKILILLVIAIIIGLIVTGIIASKLKN